MTGAEKLSIIIPVWNERATIEDVIDTVLAVDVGMERELIILDGCSDDGTRELLMELDRPEVRVILEEERRGKGAAVRRGFEEADGDIVIIQDGDLELDPGEIPKLLEPIVRGQADVVYGSRFLDGRGTTPLGMYLGNKAITWLTNALFFTWLTDVNTAYKAIRTAVLDRIDLRCNGFDIEAEITNKLLLAGVRIHEIPIRYEPRTVDEGKKLHWSAGFRVAKTTLRNRFRRS
jgi:glycosyltransferase involved in cell wall biosynthesis